MYINTQILNSKELSFTQLILLQLCKQQKFEDHSEVIEKGFYPEDIDFLLSRGLIEEIKGSKKQTKFEKLRCSSKGVKFLDDVETPEALEEDLKIFDWLKGIYLSTGRELGNQKKTKMFIALFRTHSGIDKNKLAYLCNVYINDEEQFLYNKRLEFLFFKPATQYEKFNIEGSRLYQYYLKYENMFLDKFSKL